MKTLAELKRKMIPGTILTLVDCPGLPNHKYKGIPRKIEKSQSNGIMFEGGSWLYYGKANTYLFSENGFKVDNSFDNEKPFTQYLEYIFN